VKVNTLIVVFLLFLAACRRDDPKMMDKMVRHTLTSAKVNILKKPEPHDPKLLELGKILCSTKILSGRKDISWQPVIIHHYIQDVISLIGVGGRV
jgi:hypothetical protein